MESNIGDVDIYILNYLTSVIEMIGTGVVNALFSRGFSVGSILPLPFDLAKMEVIFHDYYIEF